MEKRKVGSLNVSAIGMGCMGFSHGYGEVPSEEYAIEVFILVIFVFLVQTNKKLV